MNGPHDLGGQMGFGPVAPERNEPLFHAAWEKRALGITLSCGAFGAWTIDESRHARENIPPADYLSASYYEIWTRALEVLLDRHGFVTPAEIEAGHKQIEGATPKRVLKADMVAGVLAKGGPCDRPLSVAPRFAAGDRVKTKNLNPSTHTRLPRYAHSKTGVIETVQGSFVFPDDNAHGNGENPQWVYTVVFDGREIWGNAADPSLTVSIDAWESYLEPAEAAPLFSQSPGLPRSANDAPVFPEPWAAEAFAMTIVLYEKGLFTWPEWAETLSAELLKQDAQKAGSDYFDCWVAALIALLIRRGIADADAILALQRSWQRAAEATPHGVAIELGNDPLR